MHKYFPFVKMQLEQFQSEQSGDPSMQNQMCWLPQLGSNGEKILHLRNSPQEPWRPYKAFAQYAVPDYPVPRGSKGWATYQVLRQKGWVLVSSLSSQQTVEEFRYPVCQEIKG
jgi:hypothetical protein